MQVDKGTFKKMFPHLAEEVEEGKSKVDVNSVRSDPPPAAPEKKPAAKCFDNYNPDVIDFLCRCDTAKQAAEIIDYL